MRNERIREQGGGLAVVLLFLVLLVALGGANYVRNVKLDEAEQGKRPYAKLSVEQLDVLAKGYRIELAQAKKVVAKNRRGRVKVRDKAYFGDKVAEFERVQRATDKVSARQASVSELEGVIEELRKEKQRRQDEGSLLYHLTRAVRI